MATNGKAAQHTLVYTHSDQNLILNREQLANVQLTAQELGILVHLSAVFSDPKVPEKERGLEIWDVLLRFPEDDPIKTTMAIKRLVKKGYIADDPNINAEILNILQEKYGVTLQ